LETGDDAMPPKSPLAVLRQRNFRLYWIGQFISLTGSWMQVLAQSLLVLELSKTARALGWVNFAAALPPAILLLYSGAIADRFDKRKILIVTQVFFMLAAGGLAILVKANVVEMWHVLTFAAILGIAQAFDLPANQALVPELVDKDEIASAVQLNQAIFHGSRVIGPPLASVIVALFSLYAAFVVNALSFIPVIGTLMVIRALRHGEVRARPEGGTLAQIREGYAYVRGRPFLMALLGITASTTILIFPNFAVLTPFYVEQVLLKGPRTLGVLMGVSGVGAVLGALSLLTVPYEGRLRYIGRGLAGIYVGTLLMAFAPYLPAVPIGPVTLVLAVAAFGSITLGFAVAAALGMVATILQQNAPDRLRGRIMSLQTLVFLGAMPFASLGMSTIVDVVTMPVEMFVTGTLFALASVFLFGRLSHPESHAAIMNTEAPAD
jgi:MFS family permease